jgi:magnesium-transporting ATPase (P-type)
LNDGETYQNDPSVELTKKGLDDEMVDLLKTAILMNSDVTLQAEDPRVVSINADHPAYYFQPVGSSIEKGMINFLADKNIHATLSEYREKNKIKMSRSFDQDVKNMIVIIQDKEDPDNYTMIVKGAPESILSHNCSNVDDIEGTMESILTEQCDKGLKCISYAMAKIDKASLDADLEEGENEDDQLEKHEELIKKYYDEANFEYLATFGLKDEIALESVRRPISMLRFGKYADDKKAQEQIESDQRKEIEAAKKAKVDKSKEDRPEDRDMAERPIHNYVKIRIVTGDHMRTAQAVALEAGIMSQLDFDDGGDDVYPLMKEGQEFEDEVLANGLLYDRTSGEIRVSSDKAEKDKFKQYASKIAKRLKILSRCTPFQKTLFV